MVMKLYKLDASPPARSVQMVAEILKIQLQQIDLDLPGKKEHLTPEFLAKNPLHTIPTLEDGDFILHDSHAIITYFMDKYGTDDSLYPKDLKLRALVDQKLYFDATILFPRLRNITMYIAFEGVKTITEKQYKDIDEAYSFMEAFLTKNKWLAGSNMTLADITAVASITSLIQLLPLDVNKYPKTNSWLKTMEQQPFCKKCNEAGAKLLGEIVRNMLIKNNQ